MKKVISVFLGLIMLLGLIPFTAFAEDAATYWTDSGNYDTSWYSDGKAVYEIGTAKQLAGVTVLMRNRKIDFSGKTLNITADIDLSGHEWVPIGHAYNADNLPYFVGTLSGNGHKITNMNISLASDHRYSGFFGEAGKCVIKDITVQGNVSGQMYAAILCAAGTPEVINCRTEGTVSSNSHAAGILSYSQSDVRIVDCTNYADVNSSGYYSAGILASGGNYILNCSNFGNISTKSSYGIAGGISASASSSVITNCLNAGNISVNKSESNHAWGAGITASGNATFSNCLNVGTVSDSFERYGAVQPNEYNDPFITNCFALEGTIIPKGSGLSVELFPESRMSEVTEKLNAWAAAQTDNSLIKRWNSTTSFYPTPEFFAVEVTVNGLGGTVSPSGTVYCKAGESLSFTAVADKGCHFTNTAVADGNSVAVENNVYTFTNINKCHSYSVSFEKCNYAEISRKDASDEQEGFIDYACTVCGDTYLAKTEYVDADSAMVKRIMSLIFMLLELVFALVSMTAA